MEYRIEHGPVFTSLSLKLVPGDSLKVDSGAMVSMSPSIEMEAKTSGKGFFGSIKSAVGGEGLFLTEFTAPNGPGELVLAPSSPGEIIHFNMEDQSISAQSGAFLAGDTSLELSTEGSAKALISGEGLFLQKITGTGNLFLNSYGAVIEKTLAAGEDYIVDTGHIVAFESTVKFHLKKAAKGLFSTMASGEGFVCRYTGPGRIWYQTRNLSSLAKILIPFLPSK